MPKRTQVLLITLAALFAALASECLGWLEPLEQALWDTRVKWLAAPERHDSRIKLVLIDQSSLDWAEQSNGLSWPWPREMYSAITEFCRQGGAKGVIFDMLFSEPSLYGSSDDRRFAEALKGVNAVGAVVLSDSQGSTEQWPSGLSNGVNTPDSHAALPAKSRAAFPVDPIAGAFRALGSVVATPDDDGVLRRVALMHLFDGVRVPSLSLAAYMNARAESSYYQETRRACLGEECIPLDGGGKAVINFHGPSQTYDSFNAAAIIESKLLHDAGRKGSFEPEIFRDSYVFVGVSAPGLMDLKSTPIQGVYPGVEAHATILDNLLHGDFIAMAPQGLTLALSLFAALFSAAGIRRHAALYVAALYPLGGLALLAAAAAVAYRTDVWLPLSPPLLALLLASLGAFGLNYLIEGRQRRFIKGAFAQYLSPKVIDALIAQPETLKLGGRRETLTLFFSDIEGFTTISSQMDAERVALFLNDYLGLLSNAIMELGGTIDKYEGDAIIAFWNAPLPQEDHAALAVEAALRCQELLRENARRFIETYGHAIKTRFGIHTGEVIIGNLGTEKRFDYTFIGDAGNLAARLESANKQFGSYIMISETTKELLDGAFHGRELGRITVVGRSEPIRVFEPMASDEARGKAAMLAAYAGALQAFYEGAFDEAETQFTPLKELDPVSSRYLQLISEIRDKKVGFRNGVLELRTK